MKNLNTVREVVEAIGRARLEDLARATPQMISNWISKNRFAPHDYEWMDKYLRRRGYRAPPSLWGQADPPRGIFSGRHTRRARPGRMGIA